jgi:glycosyltransferase involved in cell wall biosynthesis
VRWLSYPPVDDGLTAEIIPLHGFHKAAAILLSVRRIKRIIAEFAPDIVSALFLPDYGWLAAMCKHHPLAVSAWGSDVLIAPNKSRWHRRRIEYVLRNADCLFADAELLGTRMQELGADPSAIRIIPLGVDRTWLEAGQPRPESTDGPIRIVTNRRLEPLYRVDTFIRAVANLARGIPGQYEFTIVGDGSRRSDLTRLADELGLGNTIQFTGTVSDERMRAMLRQSDIFVSCSSSDGTSVSLLEAMAIGCAPIVTDLTVNREWIEPGQNGLVFPVGDAEALADRIRRAAGESAWRKQACDRNRAIIEERALWPDNMAAIEDAMAETINRHHAEHPEAGTR